MDAVKPTELEIGGAGLICYLRDLLTETPKESFTRGEILVLLESVSRDPDWFPSGVGIAMWQLEDSELLPSD